ncbi:MAG: outer membrane beta-barrel protein [Thalassotalea sp.]
MLPTFLTPFRQHTIIATCCFIAFLLLSQQTLAQSPSALGPQLLIEVPFVELHSGPGIGYPVINVIEKDDLVNVLVKRTSWIKVADKRGNQGWLHQDALLNVSHSGEQVKLSEIEYHDYQQRTWEGSVMFGDFNGANFYNIALGYVFSPVISTEVSLAKSQGDISDSDIYEVALLGQPFPDLTLSPYFSVGVGLINTEPHSVLADAKTREHTLLSTAFGGKYYLARNFVLRAEYKYSLVLTDRDNNEEIKLWKLGFSVFF